MDALKLTYLGDILKQNKNLVPDWDNDCLTRDFVGTKRFSPVVYNPKEKMPERNDPQYETWWHEQYRRCIMGYIVRKATRRGHDIWIPGRLYFYLNFWIIFAKLDNVDRKDNRPPKFLSLDYFKFMTTERMFYEKKDNMFAKARQLGFSEYAGCNIAYNFVFLPGSVNVIVAGQWDYAEKTMNNVIRGLDNLGASEFYKRRSPNRSNYLKASYTEKWEDAETGEKRTLYKGFGSEVYALTALNNTQALSRLSPFFVVWEEIGKWKKDSLKETYEFVKPSLEAEGTKTGFCVFIGTGGDLQDSVSDVQDMMYKPESFGLIEFKNRWEREHVITTSNVGCFIPAYEFEIIDDDGNALIEESKKSLAAKAAKKTAKEKNRFITQKPIHLSEMFLMTSGTFFGEETVARLNEQKTRLLNDPSLQVCFKARLEWVDYKDWSKGINMIPDENGRFHITQEPEHDSNGHVWLNLYNAATDSYDKDESESSKSQGSCTIYKGILDMEHTREHWVARVTERPSEDEGGSYQFYEDTIKLCVYYGNALNAIEYSNVLIFDFYKRKGFSYLLRERPEIVIGQYVKDPKAQQRYGIEQSFIPHALNMLRDALNKDNGALIYKIYDIFILERLASFRKAKNYNCDITVSCALNIVAALDDEEIGIYSQGNIEEEDFGGYKEINGELVI